MDEAARMAFLAQARQLIGAEQLLVGEGLDAYEKDWRKRYAGRALAVARPGTTAEVAALLRLSAAHGVSLVPQGGNTGLVGGGVPDGSGQQLLLSLRRLRQIRQVDPANLTLTAEAGCLLAEVQAAASAAGLLFPLSLGAEGSCTLGGNLATNAGGTQVLRYGNARELCLGLEVVTPQGEVWQGLCGLRKDNTGYDLRDLFIGSEGTLGVITAATVKLYPAPQACMTALAACPTLDAAVALLNRARALAGATLTGFELISRFCLQLVRRHFPQIPQPLADDAAAPWAVLLELSDHEDEAHARQLLERILGEALEAGEALDAAVAQSMSQARQLWHLRESIPLAQSEEGLNIKHDIALPISAIPAFVADCEAALQAHCPGVRLVCFGHLGDGNLHFNVQAPEGQVPAHFLRAQEPAINALVYERVLQRAGSISAEHGIGQLKREQLAMTKDPVALALMRQIKKALDPQGLLNPGRLL